MSDLLRIHCKNCSRTCARVYIDDDGIEWWETSFKTIPFDKFRSASSVLCPNYQRYVDGLTDNDECHVNWTVETHDRRGQGMETGLGVTAVAALVTGLIMIALVLMDRRR